MDRKCHQRTGDIRAASGKGHYSPVFLRSVESRNDSPLKICQAGREQFICDRIIKVSVLIETNDFRRIYKGNPKIGSHDLTVQIFSAGRSIIFSNTFFEIFTDDCKVLLQ